MSFKNTKYKMFKRCSVLAIASLLMACGGDLIDSSPGSVDQEGESVNVDQPIESNPTTDSGSPEESDQSPIENNGSINPEPNSSEPEENTTNTPVEGEDNTPSESDPDQPSFVDAPPETGDEDENADSENGGNTPNGSVVECTSAQWQSGSAYAVGDTVQNDGFEFACAIAGWCASSADWSFEPGLGLYWPEAWIIIRACQPPANGVPASGGVNDSDEPIAEPEDSNQGDADEVEDGEGNENIQDELNDEDSSQEEGSQEEVNEGEQGDDGTGQVGESSPDEDADQDNDNESDVGESDPVLDENALNVFNTQCLLCHGASGFGGDLSSSNLQDRWFAEGYTDFTNKVTSMAVQNCDAACFEAVSEYVWQDLWGFSTDSDSGSDDSDSDVGDPDPVSDDDALSDAQNIFNAQCLLCHGVSGIGGDLSSSTVQDRWFAEGYTDFTNKVKSMAVQNCDAACFDAVSEYVWQDIWGFSTDTDNSGVLQSGVRGIRLLSPVEYANSIYDLLGIEISEEQLPRARFSSEFNYPTQSTYGVVLNDQVLAYKTLAADIAEVSTLTAMGCQSDGCSATQVADLGKRLFRRPLTEAEIQRYVNFAALHGELPMLSSMLMSPYFLYLIELGELDEASGRYQLNAYEIASHIAFSLWGRSPSDRLLDLADSGRLLDEAVMDTEITFMMDHENFANYFLTFIQHYTHTSATISEKPGLDRLIINAMEQEQYLAIVEVFQSGSGSISELFNPGYTFLNADLAQHYNISGNFDGEFTQTITDDNRGGLLHQGLTHVHNSDFSVTSLVKRGKMIRENMLCRKIGVPSGVDPAEIELPEFAISTRERWDIITGPEASEGQCWQCHKLMNEPGSALEHFDQTGRYRNQELAFNQADTVLDINAAGVLRDNSGLGTLTSYENLRELTTFLAQSEEVRACFVDNFFRFSSGHSADSNTENDLSVLKSRFVESGDIRSLIKQLLLSDIMLYRTDR